MNLLNAGGPFTDGRGDSFDAVAANLANGEHARKTGLEGFGRACTGPLVGVKIFGPKIRSRANKPAFIEGNTPVQPMRRGRTGHQKHVSNCT